MSRGLGDSLFIFRFGFAKETNFFMDPELVKSLGALGVVIYGVLPVAWLLVQLIDKLQELSLIHI